MTMAPQPAISASTAAADQATPSPMKQASDGSSSVGVFPPSTTAAGTAATTTGSSNNSQGITGSTTTAVSVSSGVPSAPRKLDFPTTGLPPLSNGPLGIAGSASPVALSGSTVPAPSPAPAALPPPNLPYPPPVNTTPAQVSNGPLPAGAAQINSNSTSNSNSNNITSLTSSGAPPRPLSNSSGTGSLLLPPNSTNSTSNPPTANNSSTSNGTLSSGESKGKGQPGSLNGTGPTPSTASPLKGGVPTVIGEPPFKGPPNLNGYGPGSPPNGHLPMPPSRLSSSMHSPGGHYVGPYIHPHTHLPMGHPVMHPYPSLHNHVGVLPTAAAPTASAPIIHPPAPSLDSAAAATGRTNSPAVATSAGHSTAASPLINGNGGLNPVATSTPGGLPPSSFLGGPLGLGAPPSSSSGVLMGTSTGPPPPPIPTLPYGHRGGGLVPPPVSSLYSNFPLYSPYASLHNPYLPPMAGGPLPPMSLMAGAPPPPMSSSAHQPSTSSASSPASPSSRHMNSSFSINKLTSTSPPSTTTTTSSAANGGAPLKSGSSSNSSRLGDLKASSGGLRPGSPATHISSNSSSRDLMPDHMHHLQHYGHGVLPQHHSQQQQQRAATHSPRGHSPNRERDSYSSNVSSLSRSSVPPYGAPGGGGNTSAAGPSPSLPGSSSILLAAGTPPAIGSSLPANTAASSLSFPKSTWSSPLPSTATTPVTTPRPTPPPNGPISGGSSSPSTPFPATPLFAAPLPPPTSSSSAGAPSTAIQTTSTGPPPPPTAHPFSAEVLFQTNQADLLRRELDNRFLDRSGAAALTPGGPFMRQEMHHHQHQHQHQHQHTHLHQQIMPPTSATPGPLFGPQQSSLFKDMAPKLGESPFYRSALGGMSSYPGYASSLLHPGLSGPTPFMPPSHMAPFAPKQQLPPQTVESKPKQGKTGLWNSMHVRIAWEIYHHQTKQNPEKGHPGINSSGGSSLSSLGPSASGALSLSGGGGSSGGNSNAVNPKPTSDPLLRPPSHMFPPGSALARPSSHELAACYSAAAAAGRPSPFEQSQLPPGFLGGPAGHLGSPFSRYGSPFGASPFGGLPPFPRDLPIGTPLSVHDAWRSTIPRSVGAFPPTSMAGGVGPQPPPGWPMKPDPSLDAAAAARREAEEQQQQQREREQREREQRDRERQRREREERERERQKEREKEEKLRKEQERERERERERREKERRDSERREMERERMLQQQRDSAAKQQQQQQQQQQVQRDRSPLRNGLGGLGDPNDIRIKDEPRKDDPTEMLMRAGGDRYHPHAMGMHPYMTAGRQFAPPPHLGRPMMPPSLGPPPQMSHFAPPPPHGHPGWPMLDPYRDPFAAYNQLRYNPIMEAIRADEERAKAAMNAYAAHAHSAHMRAKEPSPIPPPSCGGPSPHHRSPLGGAGGLVGGPPNGKMQQGPPPMTNGSMDGGGGVTGVKKDDPMR